MQPLQRATPINRDILKIKTLDYLRKHFEEAVKVVGKRDFTEGELSDAYDRTAARALTDEVWVNDLYTVTVFRDEHVGDGWPAMVHLSIRRNDRKAIRDWRHFQEIKNQLVGPENEGVELYPKESRLMDAANQYHVYVLKDTGITFPFGYTGRSVSEESVAGSVQRPFEKPQTTQTGEQQ